MVAIAMTLRIILSEKIEILWKRIFPEWFPRSGQEHTAGPELELYYDVDEDMTYSEVWIPVIKK